MLTPICGDLQAESRRPDAQADQVFDAECGLTGGEDIDEYSGHRDNGYPECLAEPAVSSVGLSRLETHHIPENFLGSVFRSSNLLSLPCFKTRWA